MAEALAAAGILEVDAEKGRFALSDIIESSLRLSRLGLLDVYEQARLLPETNLLIVADQFEELFRRQCRSVPQSGTPPGA
jgi:hypothetical protein